MKKIYEHWQPFDAGGSKICVGYALFVKRTGPHTALFQDIRRAENWETLRECVNRKHYATMGTPFEMVRVPCLGGSRWVSPADALEQYKKPLDYLYEYTA